MSHKELSTAAMKLSPKRRAILAEQLLTSLDSDAQRKIDAEWGAEAEARIDAFEAGKVRSRPVAKIVARLKNRTKR